MFSTEKESFAILFGSVSRGDYNKNSDIDVLLYNYPEGKAIYKIKDLDIPELPINFISYDTATFNNFYNQGSLFLYHIFEQGKLIDGCESKWAELTSSFKVKKSFADEINKIKNEALIYRDLEFLNGYYLSALVNLYPLLKNFCIFSLAEEGIYEFNKRECIKLKANNIGVSNNLILLQDFYDYSVREINIKLKLSPNSAAAKNLIKESFKFIRN
ncbi:nucleotidyltransferase domain-containing protein [Pantoea agglomerans]|uniref:nucleotidyltransferase domain-containing protein n=1 Tax=Enterobacter agglomerans TaxID=549 RepID=UPI003C79FF79